MIINPTNNLIGWLSILFITIVGLLLWIKARDRLTPEPLKPENVPNHIHKFSLRDEK